MSLPTSKREPTAIQVHPTHLKRWSKLTGDDLDKIQANRDRLVGKLQEEYGYTKREAERQVDDFLASH